MTCNENEDKCVHLSEVPTMTRPCKRTCMLVAAILVILSYLLRPCMSTVQVSFGLALIGVLALDLSLQRPPDTGTPHRPCG